jgi:hypothetical protein
VRWLLAVLAALTLSGCETTAEESAKLERAAKGREAALAQAREAQQRAMRITRVSTKVAVTAVTLLQSAEGDAAVVTLYNHSSTPVREVPVRVTVSDRQGATVYTNEIAGASEALISASLIPAHSSLQWIDDQVQASGSGLRASAEVGEAPVADTPAPRLTIAGGHTVEDPTSGPGAEGSVVNHSTVAQSELVVYAVARREGRIVAAGRGVLNSAPAGSSTRFQLFFIGEPKDSMLELSVPPSTLG